MSAESTHGSILDKLSNKQLPILPPGAPYLLKSLSDEKISIKELSGILEQFPIIVARLITLANSAWSSPVTAITSLDAACARLGFGVVRSVSIALAVSAPFNSNRCPAFDSQRFWCSSLLAADASDWLASTTPSRLKIDSATARVAGLLHNLGVLWLTDKLPTEMERVFSRLRQAPETSLNHILRDEFDLEFHTATGRLARHWNLPEPLVVAMTEQANTVYADQYWELAAIVGVGVKMVSSLFHVTPNQTDEPTLEKLAIPTERSDEIFERLNGHFKRTWDLASTLLNN